MTEPAAGARPRLLVLTSTYPRWTGDPEPGFVHELARRLLDRFEVTVLGPHAAGAPTRETLDGVRVLRFRYAPQRLETLVNHGGVATNLQRHRWKWLLLPPFLAMQFIATCSAIVRLRPQVIHAHWLIPQGLVARLLLPVFGIPYLVTSHGGDLFGFRGRWLSATKRRVLGAAAGATVVSSAMAAEVERIGARPRRLAVLPMGVDLAQRFTIDPRVRRADAELLFVGRLVPKKGLHHLVDALPAILARRPDATVTIVGFGPEQEPLRQRARKLGVDHVLQFTGAVAQTELPDYYRRAALLVAPFVRDPSGNQEGLPVVLMEAIGCGCPVVVGKVAGLEDLLGQYLAQVCVEPADTAGLAEAVLAVLDDPETAGTLTATIRAEAVERIDWRTIADGYARELRHCLA